MKRAVLVACSLAFLGAGTMANRVFAAPVEPQALPRPEHPMPQAQRAEWLNLNGPWDFAETDEDNDARFRSGQPYPETIVVPFCRESPLSGIHRRAFVKNVWYRRSFEIPKDWKSPRVRIHVGACDYRTRVWVNDTLVGTHLGGSAEFAFDITSALRPGKNLLTVNAFDDTRGGVQPLGKQCPRPESFGCLYTPTTGVWQTVWLEGVGSTFITEFRVDPDPENIRAYTQMLLDGPAEGLTLRITAYAKGKTVASAERPATESDNRLVLPLAEKHLWSLSDPYLYDLKLELRRGDEIIDQVSSYFGLRRVEIQGAAILINHQPVFQRLVLDQGFYPEGIWTAPSDEALRHDIEMSKAVGFNGARLHQKVFEPRYLYWADKLGYLCWGEFPSWGPDYKNLAVNLPIVREWAEVISRDRNHPAIIGWCPFNESGNEAGPLQATVVALTRELDPSRPIIESSGYAHTIPDPEVLDAHDYDQDPASFRARWNPASVRVPERYGTRTWANLPFMVSEYGGIGWTTAGGWGYGNSPKTEEEYYERLQGLTEAILDNPNIFGYCYTQITDVEQEQNGIYRYDRKPKFDEKRLRAIFSRDAAYEKTPPLKPPEESTLDWTVLVGSFQDGNECWSWRYTTEKPPDNWNDPAFDDREWAAARPPFGHKDGWEDKIRTPWTSKDLWLRQDFNYDGKPFDAAAIVIHYDNATELFVNGKPLWSATGWNDQYDSFDVTAAARAALVKGRNILAAHVHQDEGGQYFDMALLLASRPAK